MPIYSVNNYQIVDGNVVAENSYSPCITCDNYTKIAEDIS